MTRLESFKEVLIFFSMSVCEVCVWRPVCPVLRVCVVATQRKPCETLWEEEGKGKDEKKKIETENVLWFLRSAKVTTRGVEAVKAMKTNGYETGGRRKWKMSCLKSKCGNKKKSKVF